MTALTDALESAAVGLLLLDRDWRITYANAALATMTGAPAHRYVGWRLWSAFPELRDADEARLARRTADDGRTRTFQFLLDRTAGERVLEVRVSRTGEAGLLAEVHDVTPLDAEAPLPAGVGDGEFLQELAARLAPARSSMETMHALCAFLRVDFDAVASGVSTTVGDRVVLLHSDGDGLPRAGASLPVAGSVTERLLATRAVQRVARYRPDEAELHRLAEEAGIGEMLVSPLVAHGQVIAAVSVARREGDATFTARDERRLRRCADHAALAIWKARLLEQAEAASRAKTNFLATMSHELRTPLTALAGYGELLADGILGDLNGAQGEAMDRMRAVTHHLTVLIDELLAFSNLEAGREQVRVKPAAPRDMLREAAAVLEPLAREKGLAFTVHDGEPLPAVATDPDKVRQILVNLGGNAVKFTDVGGVRLRLRRGEGVLRFAVEDSGIGITLEDQARLFRPFGQLDGSLTRRYGGTGLGLYISSRLAELLGGRIEVRSAPGEGSVFELVLPLETADADADADADRRRRGASAVQPPAGEAEAGSRAPVERPSVRLPPGESTAALPGGAAPSLQRAAGAA